MMKQKITAAIIFIILIFSVQSVPAQNVDKRHADAATKENRSIAEAEIGRLARMAGGEAGVSAVHIETGRHLSVSGQTRFPMASTYKIPIAVQMLTLVDQGTIKLDSMVDITPSDLRPGSGILAKLLNKPGLTLSVGNLFNLMMSVSDNTATDILLALVGGAEAVNNRMKTIGIGDINIDRTTLEMIADASGIRKRPSDMTAAQYEKLAADVDPATRKKMRKQFNADPRDTATPEAMATLLQGIYRKTYLKADTAELLLETMQRSQTGEMRLKGMLPPGTPVAHKTGTLRETTNDVGMITLPNGAGHIVIAVFIKSSQKEAGDRERAIADIARAVYDYDLFGVCRNEN
jgi:beta-lactamase class A